MKVGINWPRVRKVRGLYSENGLTINDIVEIDRYNELVEAIQAIQDYLSNQVTKGE